MGRYLTFGKDHDIWEGPQESVQWTSQSMRVDAVNDELANMRLWHDSPKALEYWILVRSPRQVTLDSNAWQPCMKSSVMLTCSS